MEDDVYEGDEDYCHVELNSEDRYVPSRDIDREILEAATGKTSFSPSELDHIADMLGRRGFGISYPALEYRQLQQKLWFI